MTQEDLARAARVSRKTVSALESGATESVSFATVQRLFAALNMELVCVPDGPPTPDDLLVANRFDADNSSPVVLGARVRKTDSEKGLTYWRR